MSIPATVSSYFSSRNIKYQLLSHPPSNSSSETADAALIFEDHLAKGVVLHDGDGYLMVVIPASQWVSLNRLNNELNRQLQLAPEAEVERLFTDCQPGAVPPIGVAYGIETVVDESLAPLARVYLEAGDHQGLIAVDSVQFHALMKGLRHGHFCESK